MIATTDGIAWLAAPQSIAFGGYSVVLARGLDAEELVSRLTATVFGPTRTARSLAHLTSKDLIDVVEDGPWDPYPVIGLRYGEIGEWVFVVKYGGWQAEFGPRPPVSRGGAHVFQLEFEEENGKPVPPQFSYLHDERLMCAFNLHLDGSWGYDGVNGDREVAVRVEEILAAAGLPDATMPRREVHRTALEIIERCFGLSLPRRKVLEAALPAVVLEIAEPAHPFN
ncbi:DUF6461 domain-containing protein [Streptomyces sp. NPDC051287]|uniref:DUF6461 domain-containing protein n=1 Tax=Streptomyces sp. NPDC051287 TaxID=3365648 RepID=UPI00379B55A1